MGKSVQSGSYDAVVLGGGPAGLSAAILMAEAGLEVVCADPLFRQLSSDPGSIQDSRTIALLQGAIRMLERIDVWPNMKDESAPLRVMRVEDHTGRWPEAPDMDFRADEMGNEPFGYNIPMPVIVRELWNRAKLCKRLELVAEGSTCIDISENDCRISLEDGRELTTRLLAAADGRNSKARKAAGIKVNRWSYNQVAIALTFSHELFHEDTSVEFHRKPGPFTIIPLPGNQSALVWVETPAEAKRLLGLDDDALALVMQDHMHGRLGKVSALSKRNAFPVAGLTARDYAARRVALVGESAHVLPPIGAQGLNLGIRDAALLSELAEQAIRWGDDPGGEQLMLDYDRARRRDVFPRTAAVDFLNKSLLFGGVPPLQGLRMAGLTALKSLPFLRQGVMRQGLVPDDDLPAIMRRV